MLSQRAGLLLQLLVERYIRTGQPVSSKALAGGLSLSSATIRNTYAELETAGYISSPHTSAGRIPTEQGLRYFVDTLMHNKPLSLSAMEAVEAHLDTNQTTADLMSAASDVLAQMSQWVGVVTIPRPEKLILRHIEFLPLSDNRVLVILVLNQQEVQNRIIRTQRAYGAAELRQAAMFILEQWAGQDLRRAHHDLVSGLRETRQAMNHLMETAMEMVHFVFEQQDRAIEDACVLTGETNLLQSSAQQDIQLEDLQSLSAIFQKKQQMLLMLDACLCTEGVQIFIGAESGFEALKQCSLVTSTYSVDGKNVGVVGVIGPTRMQYGQVIPVVEATAKLLSHALSRTSSPP